MIHPPKRPATFPRPPRDREPPRADRFRRMGPVLGRSQKACTRCNSSCAGGYFAATRAKQSVSSCLPIRDGCSASRVELACASTHPSRVPRCRPLARFPLLRCADGDRWDVHGWAAEPPSSERKKSKRSRGMGLNLCLMGTERGWTSIGVYCIARQAPTS